MIGTRDPALGAIPEGDWFCPECVGVVVDDVDAVAGEEGVETLSSDAEPDADDAAEMEEEEKEEEEEEGRRREENYSNDDINDNNKRTRSSSSSDDDDYDDDDDGKSEGGRVGGGRREPTPRAPLGFEAFRFNGGS